MGNFCTNCGRELQEGEVCNCTQNTATQPQAEATAQPQPEPTVQPQQEPVIQPKTPSQTGADVAAGFQNLFGALKQIFKNPQEAAVTLAKSENWLTAIILIAVQAVLSGLFALATTGIGLGFLSYKAADLAIVFFFTFVCSLILSAAMMGILLGLGKAVKGNVNIKSALALTGIRSFIIIPLTVVAILFTMLNAVLGLILFTIGEFFAILMIFMAIQESLGISANKALLVVGTTFVIMFILFMIMFTVYCNVNATDLLTGGFHSSLENSMDDLFDDYY